MLPQIADEFIGEVYSYRQPNLTYRLANSVCVGKIDKLEAIKQAVYCILSTERYSNPIYDDNYGVELEQYLGATIGTITATIQSTLQDALLQDDRITSVTVDDIEQISSDQCNVVFTVYTIYGDYDSQLVINT